MQSAVPAGEGAMAAVLGLSDAVIDEICVTHCEDDAYVGAVITTHRDRSSLRGTLARWRQRQLSESGGCEAVPPLPVSAPFHTPLMQPAALVMVRPSRV